MILTYIKTWYIIRSSRHVNFLALPEPSPPKMWKNTEKQRRLEKKTPRFYKN